MPDAIRWDTDLIRRYDLAGTTHTAYPNTARFQQKVGSFDLLHALRDSRKALRPLSLYVHLPFCAGICYHCGCNKVITKDHGRALPYLERLQREVELIACHLDQRQHVEQLHLGGGTPVFLSHDELRQLMAMLRQHFTLLDDDSGDYSIEIDPREADWSTMGLLRELGFNRVSVGVQDLDPDVQRAINRLQTLEQTRAIVEAARTLQFRSLNIDLIYGLPRQTAASFGKTLAEVIALQPDRVSLYNYRHLPERFLAQRRINAAELPTPAEKLEIFRRSLDQLAEAGYRYIGLDHFALPDDELAIAQEDGTLQSAFHGYTTHGHCDLIGLGVSSISQIGDFYCQNESDINLYQQSLDNAQLATRHGLLCDRDDRIRRAAIQQLTCESQLSFAALESEYELDFCDYFASIRPQLEQMEDDGLIELQDDRLVILPAGRLLVDVVCSLFDRHLPQDPPRLSHVI